MVPEVGLEPTWALSPPDFESGAYTNFATPAGSFDDTGRSRTGQEPVNAETVEIAPNDLVSTTCGSGWCSAM